MAHITFDYSKLLDKFVSPHELNYMQMFVTAADVALRDGTGQGAEMTGWLELPENYDRGEFARIQQAAAKIQSDSEVLIVIGIGGSYLGARAAIDFLNNSFVNLQSKEKRKTPQILYAGNSISSNYLADLVEYVQDKDFSVNVISKSGTTTEPAIAFRVFKELLVKKYGQEEANKRIYATTDRQKGAVKVEADANGWATFVVPDSVGGRFTVLTPVGLLPIAASGADIKALMEGANAARKEYSSDNTLSFVIFCIVKVMLLKFLLTMSHHFNTSLNGGNNWLVSQRVKIKKVFIQLRQTIQQTCTHLDNSSKKATVICLKLLFVLINQEKILIFQLKNLTWMVSGIFKVKMLTLLIRKQQTVFFLLTQTVAYRILS